MHDLRVSTALRQLTDLGADPVPRRWMWSIGSLDSDGRLLLPATARRALASRTEMRGIVQRGALVVAPGGPGRRITIDVRGRLLMPVWLRQRGESMLVGARTDITLLVIAPTGLLDGIGDILTRAPR